MFGWYRMSARRPVGVERRRCAARSKRTGLQCGQFVIAPATHCKWHGGAAPQVLAAVERRQAEAAVVEAVRTFGLRRDVSPGEALLEEVQWTAGHVEWLREQVQALDAGEVAWGVTQQVDQQSGRGRQGVDTTRAAGEHALIKMYREERKHLVRVSAESIRCGLEKARVELAQRLGERYAGVFKAVLADPRVALTPEQSAAAFEVVQRMLGGLSGA